MGHWRVFTLVLVVVGLLAGLTPVAAGQDGSDTGGGSGSEVVDPAPPPPFEPPADAAGRPGFVRAEPAPGEVLEWTPSSRVWRREPGVLVKEIYPGPVFFERPGGQWSEIDPSLVVEGDGFVPAAAPAWAARVEDRADAGGVLAELGDPVAPLRMAYPDLDGSVQGELTGEGGVAWSGAMPGGADLELVATATGLKDQVVVPDATAGGSYRVRFELPEGMTARQAGPDVEIVDASGELFATYGGGVAFDSTGAEAPVTVAVVEHSPGGVVVEVSANPVWFADAARVFPVTIDPIVGVSMGWDRDPGEECLTGKTRYCDTYVNSGAATSTLWGATTMWVGSSGAKENAAGASCSTSSTANCNRNRALVKFQEDATAGSSGYRFPVSSSYLIMHAHARRSTDASWYSVYPLTAEPSTTTSWNTQPTVGAQVTAMVESCVACWYVFDVTSWTSSWFNGTATNKGLRVDVPEGAGWERQPNFGTQFSTSNGGAAHAPVLQITYTNTAPATPTLVSPAAGATVAPDANGNVSLTAGYSDPGESNKGRVSFELERLNTAGVYEWVGEGDSGLVSSGGQASWNSRPLGGWTAGSYRWRARATDVGQDVSGWSGWRTFTVTSAPPPPTGGLTAGLVAHSDEMGLEQFYPYAPVPLGSVQGRVQLRTGNLVVQHEPVDIPGPGLNSVVRLTYNAQRGAAGIDHGAGRGWNLSVGDGAAGLEGLGDAGAGVDANAPMSITQLLETDTSGVEQVVGALLEFTDGDGTTHRFRRHGGVGARWSSPPGVSLRVLEDVGPLGAVTGYRLVRPDGVAYRLAPVDASLLDPGSQWRVVEVADRSGNTLTYSYQSYPSGLSTVWRVKEIHHNRDNGLAGLAGSARVGFDYTTSGVMTGIQAWPGQSYQRTTSVTVSGGQLISIVDNSQETTPAAGRRTTGFTYTSGVLSKVTDARGNATTVTIAAGTDGRMRLGSVKDRATKSWTFAYGVRSSDAAAQTTTATTPLGNATTYKVSGRQPVAIADLAFTSADATDQRVTGGNIVQITGPANNTGPVVSRFTWRQNRLVTSVDPTGATTTTTYNHAGLATTVTRPPANATVEPKDPVTTSLSYHTVPGYHYSNGCDEAGLFDTPEISRQGGCDAVFDLTRIATATNVAAELRVSDFHPDAQGRVLRAIERAAPSLAQAPSAPAAATDRQTSFAYYSRGSLRSVDGPRTDVNDFTLYGEAAEAPGLPVLGAVLTDPVYGGYDPSGSPLAIKDAEGHIARFTYTASGQLATATDRDGHTTSSTYDALDRLVRLDAPAAAGTATTQHTYDPNGNPTSTTSPRGNVTTLVYDTNDRLAETWLDGVSTGAKTVTTYDDDGRPTLQTGPRTGAKRTFEYWTDGSVKFDRTLLSGSGTSEVWAVTEYAYDAAGRVLFRTDPPTNATGHRPVTEFRYSPRGQVAKVIEVTSAGVQDRRTDTVYNAHGQPVTVYGPRTVSGRRAQTSHDYDRFGQNTLVSRLRSDGVLIHTKRVHDFAGNQIELHQPFRTATSSTDATVEKLVTTWTYDARNLLAEQTSDPFNAGHTVSYAYTPEQRQTSRVDRDNGVAVRTATIVHWPSGATKSIETVQHATAATRSVCYSTVGGGAGYDLDGNVSYVRTMDGTCSAGTIVADQTFGYNGRGWMSASTQRVRNPSGAYVSRNQSFTYGADGAPATRVHHNRTVSYLANFAGWNTRVTDWRSVATATAYLPSGAVATQHLGSTSVTSANVSASFDYHPDGSVKSLAWTRPDATVIRRHADIRYDIGGLSTRETVTIRRPDATTVTGNASYGYDLLDRLASFTSPYPYSTAIATQPVTAYGLDDGGNIETHTVTTAGTSRLSADPTYVTGKLATKTATVTPGDGVITSASTDEAFVHDVLGQQTRRDSSTVTNFVSSPTTTRNAVTTTTHHPSGHTRTSATTHTGSAPLPANATVTYIYDHADRIVSRTQGTGASARTTLYSYWGASPSLAEETDPAGGTKVRYLPDAGQRLIAQQSYNLDAAGNATTAGETWTWLLPDTHGNTATWLSSAGAVIEQKGFDPYGNTLAGGSARATTAVPSNTGYQGAPTDPTTGNVWLGSRLYDPTTAQFTTPDHYLGSSADLNLATDPLTGNRYLFAAANPVAYDDDGHRPCADDCDGRYEAPRVIEKLPWVRYDQVEGLPGGVNRPGIFELIRRRIPLVARVDSRFVITYEWQADGAIIQDVRAITKLQDRVHHCLIFGLACTSTRWRDEFTVDIRHDVVGPNVDPTHLQSECPLGRKLIEGICYHTEFELDPRIEQLFSDDPAWWKYPFTN